MVALNYTSSAREYPAQEFKPIPAGRYPAIILEDSIHMNKAGTGQYIKFKWQIVEGSYQGRVIFSQHNVVHSTPDAERIGRSEVQSFATALGIEELNDTADLVGRPMIANVTVREDKSGNFPPQNSVNRAYAYSYGEAADVPFDNQKPAAKTSSAPGSAAARPNGSQQHVSAGTMQHSRASGARPNTRANPFAE